MDRQILARTRNSGGDQKRARPQPQSSPAAHPLITLQRSVGNQAVQRLMRASSIQAKLSVSQPGDKHEREADNAASTVMRSPASTAALNISRIDGGSAQRAAADKSESSSDVVQRVVQTPLRHHAQPDEAFLESGSPLRQHQQPGVIGSRSPLRQHPIEGLLQRKAEDTNIQKEEEGAAQPKAAEDHVQKSTGPEQSVAREASSGDVQSVQRKDAAADDTADDVMPAARSPRHKAGAPPGFAARLERTNGEGHPLPAKSRSFFESRFKADFSSVRVHTSANANRLSHDINAKAFARGKDIYFSPGALDTTSAPGKSLLAHELTHVVQQGHAPPAPAAPSAKMLAPPGKTAGPAPASDGGESAAPAPTAPAGEQPAPVKDKPAAGAHGKAGAAEGEGGEATGQARPVAEGEAPQGGAAPASAASAAVAVKLHMPEPPSGPSPATLKRIGGVQQRAGGTAAAKAALPAGATQAGAARRAVDQPDAEAKAHAQADLMAMLGEKAAPSQEILELCKRIRKVIRDKRPPDEDALMEAKPEGEALNAGNQLNSNVEGETKKVQGNYSAIDTPPAGAPPAKGQELPGQPEAAGTPAVNASAATPDPVPAGNVSLDADAEASKKKMQDAGMATPAAQLVQSGPVAEARAAQGELDQAAKEDPAKVLAGQTAALAKAEDTMAALQLQALTALTASRAATTKGATTQQQGMVLSEEAKRTKASADAQQIFTDAQTNVTALLKPLASNAIDEWEAAKTLLVAKFKSDLAPVQKRVDERHSGVGGFFVGVWDAVTGLPSWATQAYDAAELSFANGVIAKITEISIKVNTVIAACQSLIKTARDRIAKTFSDLGGSLGDWAAQQQAKFDGQLDNLQKQAIATRDNFNKDLMDRSKEAVDEVRTEISELRKKAGGLVGRIVSAVNRFMDDPVKFIIEGLLELLGIPPAAFWAVVAKIKKVIKEIADDPLKFASNLLTGLAQGFGKFFDNFGTHMLKGFLTWLLGDIKGVQVPKDVSVKSIVTFFLQLMGITWPNIRKILVKLVGAKNVALIEKVYSLVSMLMEKGPEGIYEMIKEKLDPQSIVDQVVQLAVDFMVSAIIKQVTARIIALFNPVGAIVQALEAIYRVLKWIFQNAAKIFTLVETVVNGIGDILAGNTSGFAKAVDKALGMLIAPVIAFIADYLSLGDLPSIIADKIKSMREWILELIEKALTWIVEKGKALLAAIGIGSKEKDKDKKKAGEADDDIGEKATFFADGQSHTIWIEGVGGGIAVFVASVKEPVDALLTKLGVKAANLKSEKKKAKAEALLVEARGALDKTKSEGSKAKTAKDEAKMAPEDPQKLAAATSTDGLAAAEERALGTILKDLFEVIGLEKADQKIAIYRVVLGLAGLDADAFEEANEGVEKDPDNYRRTSRTAIVGHLVSISSMSAFLKASAPVIPREYSKVRSQIFEEWVRAYVNAPGPGPQFISPHANPEAPAHLTKVKFHGKNKRDADAADGAVLYDAKSHIAGGPDSKEQDQMMDYAQIIRFGLLDTKGGGPYLTVGYVFHDLDVQRAWMPVLSRHLGALHSPVTPTD